MRRKVALQADLSDEEEESEGDGKEGGWGKKKTDYYGADASDDDAASSDSDGEANAEAEAARLQREAGAATAEADYLPPGLPASRPAPSRPSAAAVEAIPRADAAGESLTPDDAAAVGELVAEMASSLSDAARVVGPLAADLRAGGLATDAGLSFLDAKNVLLLQYGACLAFYCLLRAEGARAADHPVVARRVQVRAFLERARPIDKRLKHQIDRLLDAAAASRGGGGSAHAAADATDGLAFAPRPDALLPRDGGVAAGAGDGAYRPPRLNAVTMGGGAADPADPDAARHHRADARAARDADRERRRAGRSAYVRELAAELADAPAEERVDAGAGGDAAALLRVRQGLEARAAAEEDIMLRVPLSKDERRRLKSARRAGMAGGALVDDFAADVAGLVTAARPPAGYDRQATAQRFTAAGLVTKAGPLSGDAGPPAPRALADRRAAADAAAAGRAAKRARATRDESPPSSGGDAGFERDGGDDEDGAADYDRAATAARSRKAARAASFAPTAPHPPLAPADATGPRAIGRDVEKNRGLTPHRRKDAKNPRVRGRKKFAKAAVRRGGQVQAPRSDGGAYGGEATGVRARVSKSVRFAS